MKDLGKIMQQAQQMQAKMQEAQEKIEFVPASSYGENCRSVVEGKSDVAYCSPISSVLSEMEGAPGSIRWLPMDPANKEGWDGYLSYRPMTIPSTISMGVSTAKGVESMTSNFVYAVPVTAEEDFVYNMAKWMNESHDNYKGSHALATRMSLEHFRNFLDANPIPVHEGTVKYLREIGAWTEEDDAWNNEAIEKMDAHQLAEDRTIVRVGKMTIPVEKTNSVSYVVADFALKVESFELAERYKRVEEATRIRDSLLSAMSLAAESNVLRGVAIDSDALAALIRDLLSKEHAGIDDVMFVSLYKQDLARL